LQKEKKKFRKKKKLGTYQYGSVIFSVTLALLVIGLFGLVVLQANQLTSFIKQNIELQVYLDKDISQNQIKRIQSELQNSDYISTESDSALVFISNETAAQKFIEETGEEFSNFLGDNPLRDAFVLKVAEDYQSNEKMQALSEELSTINGVFEVTYVTNLVDSINSNLTKISLIMVGMAGLLIVVVLLLINNTIKLALFSQRFLIRSMQLVGAKSRFIKQPFLNRSLLHGVIAGIIASALLFGILTFANQNIDKLEELQRIEWIAVLYLILIVGGGLLTYLSTARAMNKYLKMSLDELY
jgi:cell division transport system permease protein